MPVPCDGALMVIFDVIIGGSAPLCSPHFRKAWTLLYHAHSPCCYTKIISSLTNGGLRGTQFRYRPHVKAVIVPMDCLKEVMKWDGD